MDPRCKTQRLPHAQFKNKLHLDCAFDGSRFFKHGKIHFVCFHNYTFLLFIYIYIYIFINIIYIHTSFHIYIYAYTYIYIYIYVYVFLVLRPFSTTYKNSIFCFKMFMYTEIYIESHRNTQNSNEWPKINLNTKKPNYISQLHFPQHISFKKEKYVQTVCDSFYYFQEFQI